MRALVLWLSLCSAVHAQDAPLAEAESAYREAEFDRALDAVARALGAGGLSRGALLRAYELRALAHRGLGDDAGLDEALRVIAAIDPAHVLGADAPPRLRARFDEIRASSPGPVEIAVSVERGGGELVLEAQVTGDALGLVTRAVVSARPDGGGWQSANGALALPLAEDTARVLYYAEAIGPAGAPIASAASRDAPLEWSPDEAEGLPLWPFVAGGAALVVAAVVVGIVLASSGDDVTRVQDPALPWE